GAWWRGGSDVEGGGSCMLWLRTAHEARPGRGMLLVRASVRSRCARAGAAPAATRSAVGDGDHHAPVGVLGLGLLLFGALALVCQRLALALAGDLEGHPGCLVLEMVGHRLRPPLRQVLVVAALPVGVRVADDPHRLWGGLGPLGGQLVEDPDRGVAEG